MQKNLVISYMIQQHGVRLHKALLSLELHAALRRAADCVRKAAVLYLVVSWIDDIAQTDNTEHTPKLSCAPEREGPRKASRIHKGEDALLLWGHNSPGW